MKEPDFQKFYYDKVGRGEACGCAERVIDMHEFDRLAGRPRRMPYGTRKGWFHRLLSGAILRLRGNKSKVAAAKD